jgi:hypothetical protein
MSDLRKHIVGLTLLMAASGCTTTPPEPPPAAVLSIVGKTCAATPSLANAHSLTPKKKETVYSFDRDINASSPCVLIDGQASNYAIFELPSSPQNHTLTVGGQKQELRTLAPLVSILDGQGGVLRTFASDRFTNLGTSWAVQFRPTEQARYVMVRSDPGKVGTEVTSVEVGMTSSQNYMYNAAGGASYTTVRGFEGAAKRVFSHEGKVTMFVQAVSGKIGLPEAKK